jgi:hypothetical protein
MPRMVRKQVYITPEQGRLLKRRAKALGKSEAEIVRQGIELASRSNAGFSFDRRAWQELKRDMAKRGRMKVPQTGRTWTREELYEERIVRYSR